MSEQEQSNTLQRHDRRENVNRIDSDTALSLDEFSDPTVDFKVSLDKAGERDAYERSELLDRIYTSTDRSITFDMMFKPKLDCIPRVRIMLVCANLLHHPLTRCSYHRKGDNTTFKDHVVRHKDSSAQYVGTASGKTYRERLAILVPLDESGLKSISLDFVCLNSCQKIRKIKFALVFTLEDGKSGNILARSVFNVQITKNFKRDMEVAEKGPPVKRPSEEKPKDQPPTKRPLLEHQPSTSSSGGPSPAKEPPVSVKINMELPREAAQEFLKHSQRFFEAMLYTADEQQKRELLPCLDVIRDKLRNFESNPK